MPRTREWAEDLHEECKGDHAVRRKKSQKKRSKRCKGFIMYAYRWAYGDKAGASRCWHRVERGQEYCRNHLRVLDFGYMRYLKPGSEEEKQ